ncbi:hypothetical protein [Jiangella asiatica]|uniref:Uncharacterized protein n=1 Tax=Jiangella asiatica TaxID=2530372 RepID=A0A4R5DJD1_9ACTN|nr:hypothetical protein [Jiangella asiatica]TDE10673.1 hypothetical protein E1269_11405 [Jiangella asiatica]
MAVHAKPPVALSALAPLVTAHAGTDPEADRILAEAADHLLAHARAVRAAGDPTPIVLAGSLLPPTHRWPGWSGRAWRRPGRTPS